MTQLRFASFNLHDMYAVDGPLERDRYRHVERLIRELDLDALAVQELHTAVPHGVPSVQAWPHDGKQAAAGKHLMRLSQATGMAADIGGQPAVAVGGGVRHVGLLWRAGLVEPKFGNLVGRYGRAHAGMWHSMITAVVEVGGVQLRLGSVHLSPFSQTWALNDTDQILRAMQTVDGLPGFVGGDFNGLGADDTYDPNPYTGTVWHPHHAHQLFDGVVNRAAAIHLEHDGRMQDCARLAGTPWTPTTGHHDTTDRHPPRRLDRTYATHNVPAEAVIGFEVVPAGRIGRVSDHLPTITTVETAHLPRP